MKVFCSLFAILLLTALFGCRQVDRSSEQPLAPEVKTIGATQDGDSLMLFGEVTASRNSRLRSHGFKYGNDTLRLDVSSTDTLDLGAFTASTRPLLPGMYFFVAYARNGIGTSYGDTLWVDVE